MAIKEIDADLKGFLSFTISNEKVQTQRTRYGFWQLISDVGGFHDGLKLLVNIFFTPLFSLSFASDFVDKGVYAMQPSVKTNRIARKLRSAISTLSDGQSLNTDGKLLL